MKFNLETGRAAGACSPGFAQAQSVLQPGRDYTAIELLEAGLTVDNLIWLIGTLSPTNPDCLAVLQRWARNCGASSDLTSQECADFVAASVRDKARELKSCRQARAWTYEQFERAIHDTCTV